MSLLKKYFMPDFTLHSYITLLQSLLDKGYVFQPFCEFLEESKERVVILRHDVDALPNNSLKTAQIEHELEIKGSYYFRTVSQSNNPTIIQKIVSLGHEIGYHYEDLALCHGNLENAAKNFAKNLQYFRQFSPIKTICMHGSPLSRYDNKKLWEQYNYHDFNIVGEPYFDLDFSKVLYLTDTGRRWDGEKVSVRDRVGTRDRGEGLSKEAAIINHPFHNTHNIINAAYNNLLPDQIMITVHPQRWTNNPFLWSKELVMQNLKNLVKGVVVKFK